MLSYIRRPINKNQRTTMEESFPRLKNDMRTKTIEVRRIFDGDPDYRHTSLIAAILFSKLLFDELFFEVFTTH